MIKSGDFLFDVPVKDPLAEMLRVSGSYPWRLDEGYTTVVHLKNTIDKQVYALLQVRFEGGSYNIERIKMAAYQTVAVDIKQLRDAQQQDIRGTVMPKDVESGQVVWFEEEAGSLIGRAEVATIATGVASSFSCSGNCSCPTNYYSAYLTPSSSEGPVGGTAQFTQNEMRRDCQGSLFGPYNRTSDSTWSSSDTSVMTVSAGLASCLNPGTAGVTAQFQAVIYGGPCGICCPTYIFPTSGANVTVTCATPTGETTAASGWLDTIGLFDMTLTPASTNFANRVVSEQNPGGGSDTCWFSGSAFDPFTSITGGSWTVESGNRYGFDGLGVNAERVNYYRSSGRAPCRFTLPQRMVIICPSIAVPYVTNTLVFEIGTTTITANRAEASQTKTWP